MFQSCKLLQICYFVLKRTTKCKQVWSTKGWVNGARIFIFERTIPLNLQIFIFSLEHSGMVDEVFCTWWYRPRTHRFETPSRRQTTVIVSSEKESGLRAYAGIRCRFSWRAASRWGGCCTAPPRSGVYNTGNLRPARSTLWAREGAWGSDWTCPDIADRRRACTPATLRSLVRKRFRRKADSPTVSHLQREKDDSRIKRRYEWKMGFQALHTHTNTRARGAAEALRRSRNEKRLLLAAASSKLFSLKGMRTIKGHFLPMLKKRTAAIWGQSIKLLLSRSLALERLRADTGSDSLPL